MSTDFRCSAHIAWLQYKDISVIFNTLTHWQCTNTQIEAHAHIYPDTYSHKYMHIFSALTLLYVRFHQLSAAPPRLTTIFRYCRQWIETSQSLSSIKTFRTHCSGDGHCPWLTEVSQMTKYKTEAITTTKTKANCNASTQSGDENY